MTTKAIRALFWKEYRQQYLLWVALFVLCVLMQLGAYVSNAIFSRSVAGLPLTFESILLVAFYFVMFYTIASSAILFSREREEKTDHFLRNMPISGNVVFVGKMCWLLSSILLLAVTLLVASLIWLPFVSMASGTENTEYVAGLVAVNLFSALCFGLFWSSIVSRQLVAVIMTMVTILGVWLFCSVLAEGISHQTSYRVGLSMSFYLAFSAIIGGIGVWKGNGWLRHKTDGKISNRWLGFQQRQWRRKEKTIEQLKAEKPVRGEFRWLLWQGYRQSSYLFLMGYFVAAIMLVLPFISYYFVAYLNNFQRTGNGEGLIAILLMVASVTGFVLCVFPFFSDQQNNAIMVLSQRGISPGKVWWSRITLFGGLFALCIAALVARYYIDQSLGKTFYDLSSETLFLSLVFYSFAFCIGQLASLMSRSFVISIPLAGIGVLLAYTWCGYVAYLSSMGFILGIALTVPFLLSCFVASRLRMADWMRGRSLRVSWLPMTLSFLVPFVILMVVIPCVRIYSVPNVMLGYQLDPFVLNNKIDYEANDKQFGALLSSLDGKNDIADYKKCWEQLKEISESPLKSPGGLFYVNETLFYKKIQQQCNSNDVTPEFLKDAIVFLETDGKHQVPWSTYTKRRYEWAYHQIKEDKIFDMFLTDPKDQVKGRQTAIKTIYYMSLLVPWEKARALRFAEYRFQLDSLYAEQAERLIYHHEGDPQYLVQKAKKLTKTRTGFISDYCVYAPNETPLAMFNAESWRRAMIITLALRLWHIEHGELPENLAQLEGTYLTKLPMTPYFDEPYLYYPKPDGNETAVSVREHALGTPYLEAATDREIFETPNLIITNMRCCYDLDFATPTEEKPSQE